MRRLLFDVTGLLQWYGFFAQPSGIQRVTEQLIRSTSIRTYPNLIYVARPMGSPAFVAVDPDTVLGLCAPSTRPAAIARARRYLAASARLSTGRGLLADCRYFHLPYVAAGYAHAEAWVEAFFAGTVPRPAPALVPVKALGGADVLFNPGDYWSHETYARSLRDLMQASNIRLALLVHDLFATYRRDWSHPVFGPHIEEQFNLLAPHVDCWLATSQYVRTSIQTHLQALNLPEPPVNVLPLGQARVGNQAAMDIRSRAQLLARLGVPNTYILCVGTIEPRKNLAALLDALRDLRTDRSIDVPHCVLVGRDGWKSQGLKRRLRATDYEDRTVTWLRNLSDIELGALYDGACFTVLPSHGEGWGLSIGESIAHGVPWVATNVGGTVEAGTAGGIHFDPADPAGLKEALRLFIQDPSALQQAHEALRTAQSSRPSWDTTGQLLLEALLR